MPDTASGILRLTKNGGGVLCDPLQPFDADAENIVVLPRLVRTNSLVRGVRVTGSVRKHKRVPQLASVESVCGLSPEQFKKRTHYTHLVAIDPSERFQLAAMGEMSMRAVDLVAPIGKGTRGLIVSPPKAGKTTLLRLIGLLDKPASGRIYLGGQDVTDSERNRLEIRRRIAMVFQKPAVFNTSVYDNVAYGPRLHGPTDRASLEEIVEKSLRGAALWDEVKEKGDAVDQEHERRSEQPEEHSADSHAYGVRDSAG